MKLQNFFLRGIRSVSRTGVEDDGEVDYSTLMETKADRRRRRFSLAVICFTSFTFTFSYSIILTSAKPYLDEVSFSRLRNRRTFS